jgi:predicted nucleic acid-binding protein
MSEGFVVDSSVGVAWVIPSQASEAADQLLEKVAAGSPMVVPSLWTFEVANSLLVLLRRKLILAKEHGRGLDALGRLPLVIDEEGCRVVFISTSKLAAQHNLSVYDAAYLELALRRKLPLASRDQALCRAARDCRVPLLL